MIILIDNLLQWFSINKENQQNIMQQICRVELLLHWLNIANY